MARKGSKPSYKPKVEYKYTTGDIADAAGMTRNAVGVAKIRGEIDPADFKSVVSFLIRRIVECRLSGDLWTPLGSPEDKRKRGKRRDQHTRRGTRKSRSRK